MPWRRRRTALCCVRELVRSGGEAHTRTELVGPYWDPSTGLRVLYECGLRRLTARAPVHNTVLSFAVSTAWQRADLVQVGPHRWAGCCHARRCPKVLARSVGRSPQPPGELEPVMERRIPTCRGASSPCRSWVAGASTVRSSVHRVRTMQVSGADPRGLAAQ